MKFLSILAVVATSTAVVAMPSAEGTEALAKRGCRNGDSWCGVSAQSLLLRLNANGP
jgi:DUF1009 family protein